MNASPKIDTASADDTCPRILAFLASVRLVRGLQLFQHIDERFHRGRAAIERLAAHATGVSLPTLPRAACADVLCFLKLIEPIEPDKWWDDANRVSHVCGYNLVLEAIEKALRRRQP